MFKKYIYYTQNGRFQSLQIEHNVLLIQSLQIEHNVLLIQW